jgi:hypothetical protein
MAPGYLAYHTPPAAGREKKLSFESQPQAALESKSSLQDMTGLLDRYY